MGVCTSVLRGTAYFYLIITNLRIEKVHLCSGMANRSAPAPRSGGANKTCQFKLVLLGESAVGEL